MRRVAKGKFWGTFTRPTVLPNRFKFHTRYVETSMTVTATSGAPNAYIFRANGLYDPDATIGGHQPIGFDQFMAMYDHFTVIASKIRVELQNTSSTIPALVAIEVSDSATIATNFNTLLENGLARWRRIEPQGNARDSCVLTKTYSTRRFFGRAAVLAEDNLRGTVAADPSEIAFFKVYAMNAMGSTDAAQIRGTVQIDYIAILTEPKLLTGS